MKKIKFQVVTLFPELIQSYLKDALLSKAITSGVLCVDVTDLRPFSDTKYKSVDDTVFGGGDGMLFKYKPLASALNSVHIFKKGNSDKKVVYLSPQGKPWNSSLAKEWSKSEEIILVCGRYAGVDQRFIHHFVDEEVSIGDYVLSGGELGALVMIESISRFIPGVLGDQASAAIDSFEDGLLEAPQFTKPQSEDGFTVPAVLVSGNHQKISEWQKKCAILTTLKKRPDLLARRKDINWPELQDFYKKMNPEEKTLLGLDGLLDTENK
ncbi:MAG: tRNA (guanosine(37)-N1)-methyltransferase TrmD [Bdellovibrio sp.]|nr:tRNA (guanosine(37)-N1)-methyltransferase TrmD [Bdellovibrio sp.]